MTKAQKINNYFINNIGRLDAMYYFNDKCRMQQIYKAILLLGGK